MALKKEKKVEIVADLDASLKDAQSAVFVKFDKLTVADVNALRRSLQKEGDGYTVATRGIDGELPVLEGQIAVAYGTDLLAPAREVYAFQKGHKENISIVGGMFEGKYMNKQEMESIATIPPREVLLSQIAYLLKSPLQRLAIAVNAVAGTKA